MYEIITYKNKDGEDKITEYITELSKKAQTSKISSCKNQKDHSVFRLVKNAWNNGWSASSKTYRRQTMGA